MDLLNKGIFAHPGITSDEEVHMMAMAMISTPCLPTRRLLDVLVRMALISFTIPWRLPRSSTLFALT